MPKIKTKTKRVYRSGFEGRVATKLKDKCPEAKYEEDVLPYTLSHKYIPDFTLPNGVFVEAKGLFTSADRTKLKAVKAQNPTADIRILFQKANNTLTKASSTTYAQWATKYGFPWAEGEVVPVEWYDNSKANDD